jgi:hypothetical protein
MSVIGGKLFMPADLQVIRRYVVETPILKAVTEELRAVVETLRPRIDNEASTKDLSKCPPTTDNTIRLWPGGNYFRPEILLFVGRRGPYRAPGRAGLGRCLSHCGIEKC